MPRLISVASTALPETVLVLLFADLADEARAGARAWLELAQDRGWPVAAAMGASVAALVALYRGEVGEAAAYGQQALAGSRRCIRSPRSRPRSLGPRPGRPQRTHRGAGGGHRPRPGRRAGPDLAIRGRPARQGRPARGGRPARRGRGRPAGRRAPGRAVGHQQPGHDGLALDAALSLSALGDARTAAALCDTEVALARRWGAGRALGVALRAAGLVAGGDRGLELLTEAVAVLRPFPAPLELARALIDLGAAHRRAGSRAVARDLLREGLDIAHGLGSAELAAGPGPSWPSRAAARAATRSGAGTRSRPASCGWPSWPPRARPTGRSRRPCSSRCAPWRTT